MVQIGHMVLSQSDPVGTDQATPPGAEALTHATVVAMVTACLLQPHICVWHSGVIL